MRLEAAVVRVQAKGEDCGIGSVWQRRQRCLPHIHHLQGIVHAGLSVHGEAPQDQPAPTLVA